MKIIPPALDLDEFEGFTTEKDIFQRQDFAMQLTELVRNSDGELVIGLDAPWGQGKTTFVKMWRGVLHNSEIPSIYFDAFQNDHSDDPLLSLIGALYSQIDSQTDEAKAAQLKSRAVSVLKLVGKASLRIGLRAATGGLVDGSALEDTGAEGEIAGIADNYLANRLSATQQAQAEIDGFKTALQKFAEENEAKKMVFFVDELDRCSPHYALELLEKIKHILSVPGIVFVLVMNRRQMNDVVVSRYGEGIDAVQYLQKFVHLWIGLPPAPDNQDSNSIKYLLHCLSSMGCEIKTDGQQTGIRTYRELVEFYDMSLRDVERSLTNYAIIHNISGGRLNPVYSMVAVFVSVIKVLFPDAFAALVKGTTTYERLVDETDLESLISESFARKHTESHPLKSFIRLGLADDEEMDQLVEEGLIKEFDRHGDLPRALSSICNWLETIRQ